MEDRDEIGQAQLEESIGVDELENLKRKSEKRPGKKRVGG